MKIFLELQQEHFVTAEILPQSLLENSLIQNLLDRYLVKYQLDKTTWKLRQSSI
ncbi:MAG: hypothetical protein AAGA16_15195 [Cyanobacteria bacterium P01_E01_bin.35]